jgi:glutamyl-tRNA synthetase
VYNKLFALQHAGVLILRIEDTDIDRHDADAEQAILDDLRWLGITWDEGPDLDGTGGPYRQSERQELYQTHARVLLESGKAYQCYCTQDELAEMRRNLLAKGEQPRYTGRCRDLSSQEIKNFQQEGRIPSLRFRVPDGVTVVRDLIHGTTTFENRLFGDFVLMRSDGRPAYNFAAVVDDAAMKVTHVIRGEDHLPNTPRQLLLYQAFDFTPPGFAHHPMLLGPDGNRLSKRHGATSIRAYREEGFLPLAMVNYLALIGHGTSGPEEPMPWEVMAERFALNRISKSAAIFDRGKLRWLNKQIVRTMRGEDILEYARPLLSDYALATFNEGHLAKILDIVKENSATLDELNGYVAVFLPGIISIDEAAAEILRQDSSIEVLRNLYQIIIKCDELTEEHLEPIFSEVQARTGQTGKKLFAPIRAAVTGSMRGPQLHQALPLLSKETLLDRLRAAVQREEY